MIFAEKCRLRRTPPGLSGLCISALLALGLTGVQAHAAEAIVHDAEYYILESQNGERWAAEDKELDKKLAALEKKYGQPPNIVYILWDDQQVGAVGNAMIQKNLGYTTPNINKMAAEG
ncbi:MAG: sulfatase, partial [Gammaproteobacteria bacterium]